MMVINDNSSNFVIPWRLLNKWHNCKVLASHIYIYMSYWLGMKHGSRFYAKEWSKFSLFLCSQWWSYPPYILFFLWFLEIVKACLLLGFPCEFVLVKGSCSSWMLYFINYIHTVLRWFFLLTIIPLNKFAYNNVILLVTLKNVSIVCYNNIKPQTILGRASLDKTLKESDKRRVCSKAFVGKLKSSMLPQPASLPSTSIGGNPQQEVRNIQHKDKRKICITLV